MHHKWPERFCGFGDFAGMITLVPFCPARILLSLAGKWDQDSSTQCATKVFQLIGIYLQYFTEKLFSAKALTQKKPTSHLCALWCLPGWRWSPKSWPSKQTWWSCSHALFKWKHMKDEKSTRKTWKNAKTCEWTTFGCEFDGFRDWSMSLVWKVSEEGLGVCQ